MQPLFFIAIVPPADISADITAFKQHFAEEFGSVAALKSPPHITIVPPFRVTPEKIPELKQWFDDFPLQHHPVEIYLSGFGAFFNKQPVVFVNPVLTPDLELLYVKCSEASKHITALPASQRPFHPHVTIGFKDLSPQQFEKAWKIYKNKSYSARFTSNELVLLQHSGKQWEITGSKSFNTLRSKS
ncbi:MAG TPA: 2'-5' RNA ligase family protein [Flavobacterium sp.]|jgi:2'-5' RNA ligase